MNLFSQAISVMDVVSNKVVVLSVQRDKVGSFAVLGGGEAVLRGFDYGCITHTGDAVESLTEAISKCQKSTGQKIETLYYLYEDAAVETLMLKGSKNLFGDGEISPDDVEEAVNNTHRIAGHYDKKILHSHQVHYVIDGKDPILNPIGVCGRHLEVSVHLLLANSAQIENWHRLTERCYVKGVAIFAPLAAAYGVIEAAERNAGASFIGLYSRGQLVHVFCFERSGFSYYQTFFRQDMSDDRSVQTVLDILGRAPRTAASELRVCGEITEDAGWIQTLSAKLPVKIGAPTFLERIALPKFAALSGAFYLVAENLSSDQKSRPKKNFLMGAREKAASFFDEYF